MSKAMSALTIADDLSTDVAQAILTKQQEWGGDPRALLDVVRVVHDTLRDLSLKATQTHSSTQGRALSKKLRSITPKSDDRFHSRPLPGNDQLTHYK
jgi:hypothetical protein